MKIIQITTFEKISKEMELDFNEFNSFSALKNENLNAKLILQVHDELIIETDESCALKVSEILKEEMESCVKLSIPMTADVNIGESWYLAKG